LIHTNWIKWTGYFLDDSDGIQMDMYIIRMMFTSGPRAFPSLGEAAHPCCFHDLDQARNKKNFCRAELDLFSKRTGGFSRSLEVL
jgi:hypothetical protein